LSKIKGGNFMVSKGKEVIGKLFNKSQDSVIKITMPGREPIAVNYVEGDTAQIVLDRAKVTLNKDDSCALGRQKINDLKTTTVKPGDTLVIASKVANG